MKMKGGRNIWRSYTGGNGEAASKKGERRMPFPSRVTEMIADQLYSAHPKKTLAEVAHSQKRFVIGGSAKPAPLNYGPSL